MEEGRRQEAGGRRQETTYLKNAFFKVASRAVNPRFYLFFSGC